MSDKKTDSSSDDKLDSILERFELSKNYYADEYTRNKEDCEFALGDQWPENIKNSRRNEGRPCLTENRMLPFINQVVNDIRKAKPSIIVKPVDSGADVETAKVLRGIIRNIETVSDAETAYDTAAYNAVSSGYGWIRVKTDYASYESFDQEIQIERIMNPFSVYVDPNSQRLDASDAEYVFVFDDIDLDDFKEMYPDAQTEGFDTEYSTDWLNENKIRIAEYFYKDYTKKTLYKYSILTMQGEQVQTGYELPEGATELDKREVDVCEIKWCKVSGAEILEKNTFPSQYIPIVPVIGFETWYEGKRQVFSLIHQAKDPQRMFNYWKTSSTEVIALQPKAPYIGAKGQFKSDREKWRTANNTNYPALEYDIIEKNGVLAPPPQRQAPPAVSPTMMAETMSAADGIQATLGMYDASMGQQTNDISGKAIISRQLQGDNANFHFVDNLSTAMKQVGRVLVDMIPRIYTGARIVRILGEDGTEEMMPLNQGIIKAEDGYRPIKPGEEAERSHQLDHGKYDVVVEVGSSYATKRMEAANSLVEIAKLDPRILEVAGDLLLDNLDIPNGKEIAERIRATMSPELLGDDLEAQRLQQMAEATKMIQDKLEQTELALQVKDDNTQHKNSIDQQKVDIEKEKLAIEASKVMAEIHKLQQEANVEIPAEAAKDKSEAMVNMQGQVDELTKVVHLFLDDKEEEVSGKPELPVT